MCRNDENPMVVDHLWNEEEKDYEAEEELWRQRGDLEYDARCDA